MNEIQNFVSWCDENCLELNVSKTKELIIDFRKSGNKHQPIFIKSQEVEIVSEYKYLGVFIDKDLQWNAHTKHVQYKMNQRMYFLSTLSKFHVDKTICTLFYKSLIESIMYFCITVWGGNCGEVNRSGFQRIIKKANKTTNEIDSFQQLYSKACSRKFESLINDPSHPLNSKITISNHSGRILSLRCKTQRYLNSFLPYACRLFNSIHIR